MAIFNSYVSLPEGAHLNWHPAMSFWVGRLDQISFHSTLAIFGVDVEGHLCKVMVQITPIFKPLLSCTTPSPPKFNVNVAWSSLAPMDEKNQPPNITFANTRAETLRFGGAGVQHSACCRVWIFCPSTVGSVMGWNYTNKHFTVAPGGRLPHLTTI